MEKNIALEIILKATRAFYILNNSANYLCYCVLMDANICQQGVPSYEQIFLYFMNRLLLCGEMIQIHYFFLPQIDF